MLINNELDLKFNIEHLKKVLNWGAHPENAPYTHQEIASWCEKFSTSYSGKDAPPSIEEIFPILTEIDTEWDCYIAAQKDKNPGMDLSNLNMPSVWFEEWLSKLNT